MAKSCKEIWTNKNFLLKFTVMICVVILLAIKVHGYWISGYGAIVIGYERTCLTIITALFITYIFIDPTKFTELCLLIVALIKLLIALILIIIDFTTSTRQEIQIPKPTTSSSTTTQAVGARMDVHPTVRPLLNVEQSFDDLGKEGETPLPSLTSKIMSSLSEAITQPSEPPQENELPDSGYAGGVAFNKSEHPEKRSIYAALSSRQENNVDNSSDDIYFYMHLVINIVAIVLIIIDIFLRAKK